MKYRLTAMMLLIFASFGGFGQMMWDSVFVLRQVDIISNQHFQKENAGMKKTAVDSLVMNQKINLSLAELLSESTPVFIRNYGRGALSTASFRGTAPSHTQVNWNGMPLNTPMAGMVDFSLIPVYITDEIELAHGAASLSNGSGGLGGSVNLANNTHWNQPFSLQFVQGVGSFGTVDNFLKVNTGGAKLRFSTRFYRNTSRNDFTFVNKSIADIDPETGTVSHPTQKNRNAAYGRHGLMQEIYFKSDGRNLLSARWWWQFSERSLPMLTSYEGSDNQNFNKQQEDDHRLVLDWNHYRESAKFTLRSGYSSKNLNYKLINNVPGLGEVPAIFSESTQQSFYNTALYQHDFSSQFSVEGTVAHQYHRVVSADTVAKSGYRENQNALSWMVALRRSFVGRLNLNFILRHEFVDGNAMPVVPYLGFDFLLLKDHPLILKGNVARNFRRPALNDLYWQPGGNPDLKVEDGVGFELGLQYQFDWQNQQIETEITAFRNDIKDWIIWLPGHKGYWEPQNISNVLTKGLEANLIVRGTLGKVGYYFAGNYAFTRAINYGNPLVWGDQSYGKQLVYIPVHSGNLMAALKWRNYSLSWQHNTFSERFTTSSNDMAQRHRLYPYFMNDMIVGKQFEVQGLDFSAELKIYNLFNENYRSVLYRPMPRRNFLFMLTMKF